MNRNRSLYLLLLLSATIFSQSCKKEYLSREQRAELFVAPTNDELTAVSQTWQARNLSPTDYKVLQSTSIESGSLVIKIVSYKVNNILEYAALVVPVSNDKLPVRIWVGGFGLNETTNSLNLVVNSGASGNRFVMAVPALRGQSLELTVNGIIFRTPLSEGEHCNAFDGATDDVLALLNLIAQTEPIAEVNRTGIRGGSRGATVAMLAGIRDPRIKRVVSVAGPVELLFSTANHLTDPTYQCQLLSAYKNGQSSLAETRGKMIASSPFYFADKLPLTQLHLGINDRIVPVQQGYDMKQKMEGLGAATRFSLFTYDRTHDDIGTNNLEMNDRIEMFFSGL